MTAELPDASSLLLQARALLGRHGDPIANAANLAALIYLNLDRVNWVGFYFRQDDELVLGPFQGKPACVSIPLGRGVCGTAASTGLVQRVDDVHDFDGHIVCDVDSRSEMVIPLAGRDGLIGVLDLDSPEPSRFSARDEELMVQLADLYLASIATRVEGAHADPAP